MKKLFEGGKIWTILSALIFVMTVGFAAYAASVTGNSYFSSRKKASDGVLTYQEWNDLMDNLDSLNVSGGGDSIPEGAVMAFKLQSCPNGWYEYTDLRGRVIVGSGGGGSLGSKEGNQHGGYVYISTSNLPAHSHHMFANYVSSSSSEGLNILSNYLNATTYDVGGRAVAYSFMSFGGDDRDYIGALAPSDEPAILGATSTVGLGNPIDIRDPSVVLLYCIKGSEPEPTQPACSHHLPNGNAVQYENGSCQNLQTTLGNQTIYVYNYDGTSAGSLSVVNGVISAFFGNPSGYKLGGQCLKNKYVSYDGWRYRLTSSCTSAGENSYGITKGNKSFIY